MKMVEVEVWVTVASEDEYAVGKTEEESVECFGNDHGTYANQRSVKITLRVPVPETLEVTVNAPAVKELAPVVKCV